VKFLPSSVLLVIFPPLTFPYSRLLPGPDTKRRDSSIRPRDNLRAEARWDLWFSNQSSARDTGNLNGNAKTRYDLASEADSSTYITTLTSL
jgi:hypothetical protein